MAKTRLEHVCDRCGATTPRWRGAARVRRVELAHRTGRDEPRLPSRAASEFVTLDSVDPEAGSAARPASASSIAR